MYAALIPKSATISTPKRQRARTFGSKMDDNPILCPTPSKSASASKGVALMSLAAKTRLQQIFKLPGKVSIPTKAIESSETSSLATSSYKKFSSEPPVLTLPASTFTKTSLLPMLQEEPQKVAPKRRHTYKLFPDSTPPQIISPVYGVDILHQDIGSKDYSVILPRLRDTRNCNSFNSTPPLETEDDVVTATAKSSTSFGGNSRSHILSENTPLRSHRDLQEEYNRATQINPIVHKGDANVALCANNNTQPSGFRHFRQMKRSPMADTSQSHRREFEDTTGDKNLVTASRERPQNNFEYYRASVNQ